MADGERVPPALALSSTTVEADTPEPTPSAAERIRRRWLRGRAESAWLFLLALIVRGLTAWQAPAIERDGVDLLAAARQLADVGWTGVGDIHHHPLPPALIALLSRFVEAEVGAIALGVVVGSAAVLPLHTLTRRACGRHAALAGGLLYACLPKVVHVASTPLAEGVFVFLMLAALSHAFAALTRSTLWGGLLQSGVAGLFAAAAYLARPEGLVIAGLAGCATLIGAGQRLPRRLASAGALAVGFLVPASIYVAELSAASPAALALSPKKDLGRFVGATTTPLQEEGGSVALGDALAGTFEALGQTLAWVGLALALLGALAGHRWRLQRSRRVRWLLLGGALLFLGLVLRLQVGWGYGGARHALSAALLLLPFAGEGVVVLGAFIRRVTSRRRFAFVLTWLIVLPLAVRAVLRPPGESGAEAGDLGRRLAETAASDETLVVASFGEPRVAHYAGRALGEPDRARDLRLVGRFGRSVLERGGSWEGSRLELATALRDEGADYLVLDVFRERGTPTGRRRLQYELAERLLADGVLELPVVAAGGRLAAFPVRRSD